MVLHLSLLLAVLLVALVWIRIALGIVFLVVGDPGKAGDWDEFDRQYARGCVAASAAGVVLVLIAHAAARAQPWGADSLFKSSALTIEAVLAIPVAGWIWYWDGRRVARKDASKDL